jgi:hypothetical protein
VGVVDGARRSIVAPLGAVSNLLMLLAYEELFEKDRNRQTSARSRHPYYSVQGPKRLSDENRILGT